MSHSPEIFLIDEALTALDPSTEKKILKNLKEAFSKATVMIITHRDTILEAMDRLFVFHDKQFSDGMWLSIHLTKASIQNTFFVFCELKNLHRPNAC